MRRARLGSPPAPAARLGAALTALALILSGAGAAAALAVPAARGSSPPALYADPPAEAAPAVGPGAALAPGAKQAPEALYVANYVGATVLIVDRGGQRIAARVPIGAEPFAVASSDDGARLYVVNRLQDLLSVLDAATGAVVSTVLVGRPRLATAEAADRLFLGGFVRDGVLVVDPRTDAVLATIDVPGLIGDLVVDAAGARAYAGVLDASGAVRRLAVAAIDVPAGRVVGTVPLGPARATVAARAALAIEPGGGRVYVADTVGDAVAVLDTASGRIVATVAVGRGPEQLAISPDGTRLYVANALGGTISVVDTASGAVVATVPVGGLSLGDGVATLPGDPRDLLVVHGEGAASLPSR